MIEPIKTRYLVGESYHMPPDNEVFAMSPCDRDAWAVEWLKKNGKPRRKTTHIRCYWKGNAVPVEMSVDTYDYTEEIEAYWAARGVPRSYPKDQPPAPPLKG